MHHVRGAAVRVTGGEWGGHALRAPRGAQVRPTADRVRESLFASLGRFDGASVFDGFAGTGALGIEALSRGAEHAVFAERSKRVLPVLRENLSRVGAAERSEVHGGDVCAVLRRLREQTPAPIFDWVFLDPPYREGQGDLRRVLELLREGALLAEGAQIVVETSRHFPVDPPEGLDRIRERRYGDTVVVYLSLPAGPPVGHPTE